MTSPWAHLKEENEEIFFLEIACQKRANWAKKIFPAQKIFQKNPKNGKFKNGRKLANFG